MKCYKTLYKSKLLQRKRPRLVTLGHCMKCVHDGKYLDLEAGKELPVTNWHLAGDSKSKHVFQ